MTVLDTIAKPEAEKSLKHEAPEVETPFKTPANGFNSNVWMLEEFLMLPASSGASELPQIRGKVFIHSRVKTKHRTTPSRRWMGVGRCCCLLWIVLVTAGCEAPSEQSYTRVNGTVSFDGTPLTAARVVFVPTRATQLGWDVPFSYGVTDESGAFALRTETGYPGVFQGWCDVWVIEMSEASDLPESEAAQVLRYSRHFLEVVPNSNGECSVEIDHRKGYRPQASMRPPAWALNLSSSDNFPRATRDKRSQLQGAGESSS
jgi:hypothetical protein